MVNVKIPHAIASIILASLLGEVFILAPALVRVPKKPNLKDVIDTVTPDRLISAAQKVRTALDHIASLPEAAFGGFCSADYGRFIIFVVIGYRLSFPLVAICRDYDVTHGRRILKFGELLRRLVEPAAAVDTSGGNMSDATTSSSGTKKVKTPLEGSSPATSASAAAVGLVGGNKRKSDSHSAIKVVLRSVITKYDEKSAALEAMSAAAAAAAAAGGEWVGRDLRSTCPMLNGSLDQYIPLWAGGQQVPHAAYSANQSPLSSSYSYANSQTGSSSSAAGYATNTNTSSGIGGMMTFAAAQPMGVEQLGGGFGVNNNNGLGSFGTAVEDKQLMHHDLWATMTMGWAGDLGEVNMEDFGNTNYSEMMDS